MKYLKLTLIYLIVISFGTLQAQIKIACIGNSITEGAKLQDKAKESYPSRLQALLGDTYQVSNFGVSGTTLLKKGNKPYWKTEAYASALKSEPDIVFIALGTNDSKPGNRNQLIDFSKDYADLINSFQQLPSHPRVILLTPITVFHTDSSAIWDKPIANIMIPAMQKLAFEKKLELLNMHTLFLDKEGLLPDKVHPNAVGANIIAERLYEHLTRNFTDFNIASKLKVDNTVGSFYGYSDFKFTFEGKEAHIVAPKKSAKGNPWVWRARFWGHEPQTDIAMLERGYHIVYCDVVELFGNQQAINLWNNFYKSVRKLGLAKKAVLEGMSRGGVYIYNWAAVNPDKVVCTYADNPVLDMKSWPGGFGKGSGSKKTWLVYKEDYGYKTDEEAKLGKNSPLDKIDAIVKGKYPMLHLVGDIDETVPPAENTIPFEKLIKEAGGNITVIHKPMANHHPHSLPNPQPIVDFILKNEIKNP